MPRHESGNEGYDDSDARQQVLRFQSDMNTMESEPARVPGLAANECAGNTVGFDCSALRSWRMKPPGRGHRLESEWGSQGPEFRVLRLPPRRGNPIGDGTCFENS
jgi:hypothetical protein